MSIKRSYTSFLNLAILRLISFLSLSVDHALSAFNLATSVGTVSHTGISGLTLGGGYGWLSRCYGLSLDNVLCYDIVLADGSFHRVTKQSYPDLFWALQGAGANFGVVTAIKYKVYSVPSVYRGNIIWVYDSIERAKKILNTVFDLSQNAPNELSINVYLMK